MSAKIYQDIEQIKKTLEIFCPENKLFEIRTFNKPKSGYFKDIEKIIESIKESKETFYFIINEIKEICYKRANKDKIIFGESTSGNDIIMRNWLLIDCDVETPVKGISTTKEEKELSHIKARTVYKFLKSHGFPEPIFADSGNGYHLLYKVQINTDQGNTNIIQDFLKVLDMLFSDDKVKIDKAVFDLSRVTKLYGTLMQKGNDEPDRPHRLSKLIFIPDDIKITGLSLIKHIADMLPKPEPKTYNRNYNNTFDLRDFISKHGIRVKQESNYSGGTRFTLEECIFDPSHKGKDAAIFLRSDGIIGYHCFHNSCSDYQWKDVRLKFEPDAYDDKSTHNGYKYENYTSIPNYRKQNYIPLDLNEIKKNAPRKKGTDEPESVFFTTMQIHNMPEEPEIFIKTGITYIDENMRGLCKGELTVITGLTGAGKTSVVSQFILECANQGYKCAAFSGELKAKRVDRWLVRQAAGKQHLKTTNYPNHFIPCDGVEKLVNEWLEKKVFIYNNRYGNQFEFIQDELGKLTKEHKLDLVILDNLMSLDIDNLSDETNKQQTSFVKRLKSFAEINDIHVVIVAHPKKINEQRIVNEYDISGSSNIANLADNIFIVCRVTDTYKILRPKFQKIDITELDKIDSEILICKDREGGIIGKFIPLYYEKESKRLKNSPTEIKRYKWDIKPTGQFTEIIDAKDDPLNPFKEEIHWTDGGDLPI